MKQTDKKEAYAETFESNVKQYGRSIKDIAFRIEVQNIVMSDMDDDEKLQAISGLLDKESELSRDTIIPYVVEKKTPAQDQGANEKSHANYTAESEVLTNA